MNAFTTAVSSPLRPQPPLDCESQRFAPESSPDSFALRAAQVDRLIDKKTGYIMESARLQALAESNPEDSERCLTLIQEMEENIDALQERIDRELKGLFYALQKAPAPSPYLDELPG